MAPKLNDPVLDDDDATNNSHVDSEIDDDDDSSQEGASTSWNEITTGNSIWISKRSLAFGCTVFLVLIFGGLHIMYQRISRMTEDIVSLRNELLLQQLVTNETQTDNIALQMENINYKKQLVTKQALIDHNERIMHTLQSKLIESQQLVFEQRKQYEWLEGNYTIERILHLELMQHTHNQFDKTIQLHVKENEMLRTMLDFSTFITNDRDDEEYEQYESYVRNELSNVVDFVRNDLRNNRSNNKRYNDILKWCGWILHSLSHVDLYRGTIIDTGGLTILSEIMKEFKVDCYYSRGYVYNQARMTLENIVGYSESTNKDVQSNEDAVAIGYSVRNFNDFTLFTWERSEPIGNVIYDKIAPILYHFMMVWIYKPVTDYVQYSVLLKNRMKRYYDYYFTEPLRPGRTRGESTVVSYISSFFNTQGAVIHV